MTDPTTPADALDAATAALESQAQATDQAAQLAAINHPTAEITEATE